MSYKGTYIILFLLALSLPLITPMIVNDKDRVALIPSKIGDFYFQREEIYNKKSKIDILFLGASALWCDINPRVIKDYFKKKYGKDLNVLVLAHNWRGEDLIYFQLSEILKYREVDMVISSLPTGSNNQPHHASKYLWNIYRDFNIIKKLSLKNKLKVYAEMIFASPKLLLTALRRQDQFTQHPHYRRSIADNYGAILYESRGFYNSTTGKRDIVELDKSQKSNISSVPVNEILIKKDLNNGSVSVNNYLFNNYEEVFFQETIDLAKDKDIKYATISVKYFTENIKNDREAIRPFFKYFKNMPPIIDIPYNKLFVDKPELVKYYYDDSSHMNKNGATVFTQSILPAIEHILIKNEIA